MKRVVDVPKIPRLARDAHKGDRGRLLIVAGSVRMSGAARLAGWGALRGGAGLVTIATPESIQPVVAAELACAMTLPLPDSNRGVLAMGAAEPAREFAESVDAIALGPGVTTEIVPFLRGFLRGLGKPIAIDADALNCIAQEPELLDGLEGPRVLTPHPGEAARLLGHEVKGDRDSRQAAAAELAERFDAVAVLKGAGTVVCDGDRFYVNRSGNPGMGSGGTGDVLTGLLGARLAFPGTEAFTAAVQAVHIHGRAGDLATAAVGEHSVIATDLVANLAAAVGELAQSASSKRGKSQKRTGSRRPR